VGGVGQSHKSDVSTTWQAFDNFLQGQTQRFQDSVWEQVCCILNGQMTT
jgi:hypothetical protein